MVYQRTNAQIKTSPAPFVGPWTCNVCREKFLNVKAHVDHMGSHSVDYPSSCLLCLSRFKNPNDLALHDCVANNKSRHSTPPLTTINTEPIPAPALPQPPKIFTPPPPLATPYFQEDPVLEDKVPPVPHTPPVTTKHSVLSSSSASSASFLTADPSPSPTSPSFDDEGPDEEDIFEAAQNPRSRRSRSSSLEANNNHSGLSRKDDFLVTDPWQAAAAVIISDFYEEENSNAGEELSLTDASPHSSSRPSSGSSGKSQKSGHKSRDIISDTKFIINSAGQRVPGKRRITPNSRYFKDTEETYPPPPMLQKQPLNNNLTTVTNNNKRPPGVRIVGVGVASGGNSSSPIDIPPSNIPPENVEVVAHQQAEEMSRSIALSSSSSSASSKGGRTPPPPTLTINPPLLDLYDIVSGTEEFGYALANQTDRVFREVDENGSRICFVEDETDSSEKFGGDENEEDQFPLHDLKCNDCHLRFMDFRSWQTHLIKEHIRYGPPPCVVMRKLSIVEVDTVNQQQEVNTSAPPPPSTFTVSSDNSGNMSISRKKPPPVPPVVGDESDSSSQSSTKSAVSKRRRNSTSGGSGVVAAIGGDDSNSNSSSVSSETRKEALKLTLCRREGQYELKRRSTDSNISTSSNNNNVNTEESPKRPVTPTPPPQPSPPVVSEEPILVSSDDNMLSARDKEDAPEKGGEVVLPDVMEVDDLEVVPPPKSSTPLPPPQTPPEQKDNQEVKDKPAENSQVPDESNHQTITGKASPLGFRRRFKQAVQTVRHNVELRKQLLKASGRDLILEKAVTGKLVDVLGDSRPATSVTAPAIEKNSVSSPPTEKSLPSLVSSPSPASSCHSASSSPKQSSSGGGSATVTNDNASPRLLSGGTMTTTTTAAAGSSSSAPSPTEKEASAAVAPSSVGSRGSGSMPGSPAAVGRIQSREGSSSPALIVDLGGVNPSKRIFQHQSTPKKEPLDVQKQVTPPPPPPPAVSPPTDEAPKAKEVTTKSPSAVPVGGDEEENRLIIDDPQEKTKDKRVEEEDASKARTGSVEEEEAVEEMVISVDPALIPDPEKETLRCDDNGDGASEQRRRSDNPQEDEDFKCSQCQEVFTCDADLNTHFSKAHIRLAMDIIQEPESPFPTITVRGTSSIFEDEVEESEPYPVGGAAPENLFCSASNTLSTLLARRRSSGEAALMAAPDRMMVEPIISNYMHGLERGNPYLSGPGQVPSRPGFPARGVPVARPPLTMMPPQEYMPRQGGSRPMQRVAPPPQGRLPLSYRPGYPTALHQALINQTSMGGNGRPPGQPQQQQQQPPPRPQLRPIGGSDVPHRPQSNAGQFRPPLTRVPPPQQGFHPPSQQNQQSIIRAPSPHNSHQQSGLRTSPVSPPTQPAPPQQQQQQQQVTQDPEALIRELRQRLNEVQKQIHILVQQESLQNQHPATLKRILEDKNTLHNHHDEIQFQLHNLERQHQIQLQHQRQRMLQLQQQQQQQMRQQQFQQQQQQQQQHAPPPQGITNKRPSVEFDGGARQSKQPRIEGDSPGVSQQSSPNSETNLVRLPNGVTLSVLPQHSPQNLRHSSPPTPPASVVQPGLHSGGSSGSRHSSSGTTSPAMVSPTMASRLAHSGITLTPASPGLPASTTPPVNPVLSPISDCTGSPRGSPRIPVGSTVIQRVPPSGSPAHTSPGGAVPHTEVNFAIPKPPLPGKAGGSAVLTNPSAERPDRPPTIDLTADEIQHHNAQMRATGGGAVSQEQIQQHEALQHRLRLTGAISAAGQSRPKGSVPCPQCHGMFATPEMMNEHRIRAHGQQGHHPYPPNHPASHQFSLRGPQVAVRRSSPGTAASSMPPHPNNNGGNSILATRLDNHPNVAVRSGPVARGPPLPSSSQLLQQMRLPPAGPLQRPQESGSTARGPDEGEKFVIPLLNLAQLDMGKLRALNEIGVMSFVPLQGITKLGIPIMRLRPDVSLGHFPHDTAIEIGPIRRLSDGGQSNPPQLSGPPNRALPPPSSSVTPPHHLPQQRPSVVAPPHAHQHRLHPQSSPGGLGTTATLCTDRNCPDNLRRPSPIGGTIHHTSNLQVHGGNAPSIHNHLNSNNGPRQNYPQAPQPQQQQPRHHESFLGSSGQLIVTPVNRH